MHPSEGDLRTYLDQQLEPEAAAGLQQHLQDCPSCRQALQALSQRADETLQHINLLASNPTPAPAWQTARTRLQSKLEQKEQTSMLQKLFARPYRTAWAVVVVVALLAASLAVPQVRAIANSFLGLFRVQKVTVVEINPQNLPHQLGSSTQLESLFANSVKVEENGQPQKVASPEQASALAGIPVRLPAAQQLTQDLMVQPGGRLSLTVQVDLLRAVLEEIGRPDIQVPDELDGAEVIVDVPAGVTAMYGDCSFDVDEARQPGFDPDDASIPHLPACTTLVQMPSPSISAPPGLDIAQIGEAYLMLLGMSQQEARAFAANVDWATTFVIPVPGYQTRYQDVSVDGVTGTLILQNLDDRGLQYLLIWVKDDIIYALTGPGNKNAALEFVSELK